MLFDCPGQVELFTHHASLRNIFLRIQKLGYRVRFSVPSPPHLSFTSPITFLTSMEAITVGGSSLGRCTLLF